MEADKRDSSSDRPSSAADVASWVERRITAGTLAPGDRMDPVRTLASRLGLAPNTVAAAYRTLGERGLLIGEGRRGTFVAARPALTVPVDLQVPAGLVDLASGNPDPDLLPPLGAALARVAAWPRVGYGDPPVEGRLLDQLRADLAGDGVAVDHLTVVGGALDGIERVLGAHLRPGARVAVEDPGYGPVHELVAAMGMRMLPVPVDELGVTPDGVVAAIGDGAAALVVTPRAHNPTGAAFDRDRAAELSAVLARVPELLVIEDDHANLVAGSAYHTVIGPASARWATVRSVAKSLGPDLRLAALAGDGLTVSRVAGRLALGPGWVSHLLQRLVVELLSEPGLPAALGQAAGAYAERRSLVVARLAAAGVNAHGRSGLNVWVPVADEGAVVAAMERAGFAVRGGARYRRLAPPGVRLSVAGRPLRDLESAADALAGILTRGAVPTRSD